MLMPNSLKRRGFGPTGFAAALIAVLGIGFAIATPALAGNIYSYVTADGNVAFTDNPKNVPARYRDQMRVRKAEGIEDYARFTGADSAPTEAYADQLAKRIEYLRELNAASGTVRTAPHSVGVASVTVSGVDLRLPAADTSAPIIIEQLRVKSAGQISTRHDTLVSQGGKPLAIVRGNQRGEVGAANNILGEEDLEFYR